MRTVGELIIKELRIGTGIALMLGALLGLILITAFLTTNHADLILGNRVEHLAAIILLTSTAALLSAMCMLPFEIFLAILRKTTQTRLSSHRFYVSVFIIGVVFSHLFFWTFTNVIRDIASPKGMGIAAALIIGAFLSIAFVMRIWDGEQPARGEGIRSFRLVAALAVLSLLSYLSYSVLHAGLQLDATVHAEPEEMPETSFELGARPNVILISIDTLRADHLSAYGYPRETTPNIDHLAEEGVLFRQALSHAPWTVPSHATMFTGLYSTRHGARFYSSIRFFSYLTDELRPFNITLAEILSAAGYRTAGFTSIHWLSADFGFDQGFDLLVSLPGESATADHVVNQALHWMETRDIRRPFFLFLHFADVHDFRAPQDFNGRYADPDYGGLFAEGGLRTGNIHDHISEADLDYKIDRYDAALAWVDSELGRFFDALKNAKLYDPTLLIVTSDHGEEFWDHGGLAHGLTLYRELLHVPLVIKAPVDRPMVLKEIEASVGLVDLAPTILDYLGFPLLDAYQGVSLRPLIENTAAQPTRILFAEDTYFFNSYAVITEEFKFISNRVPPPDILNIRLLPTNLRGFYRYRGDELYRTDMDPREQTNLVAHQPALSAELDGVLVDHLESARIFEKKAMDEEIVKKLKSLGYLQ